MDVIGMPSDRLNEVLPVIQPHFDAWAANSRGEETAQDIIARVHAGTAQLWLAYEGGIRASALTRVQSTPVKVVEITNAAGEGPDEWQGAILDAIEAWAAGIGAHRIRTIIRPGFCPFFRRRGFKEVSRIMERDIG